MKTFYAVVTLILISALPIYAGKWSTGTTAPATCALGDSWTDTNGTADNRFYTCTATNTWTLNSNQTAIDTKANKSGSVMLWSEYGGGASFDTTSPQVSYNGAFYKCINPYVKTLGEYPDTQTEYFEEVTGAGGAGDIEGVTAGTGLSGGGVSGTITLSADTTYLQRRVSSTCSAGSSIREIAADGTVTCETDDTGSGSVPSGTVNGQVLIWSVDQWVASIAPWLAKSSLGEGVEAALGFAPDTTGGFLRYSTYAADPTLTVEATPTGGAGYRVPASSWAVALDADGDGSLIDETWWSTAMGAKRSISDERKEIGWNINDSDVATVVADGKQPAIIPDEGMTGMVLTGLTCSITDLNSAASGDTTIVLRRVRGATAVDMTSTGVTIPYTDYTASDEVVDTANDDVAAGDKIFVDVNTVTSPAQKGLGCTAFFAHP